MNLTIKSGALWEKFAVKGSHCSFLGNARQNLPDKGGAKESFAYP